MRHEKPKELQLYMQNKAGGNIIPDSRIKRLKCHSG